MKITISVLPFKKKYYKYYEQLNKGLDTRKISTIEKYRKISTNAQQNLA